MLGKDTVLFIADDKFVSAELLKKAGGNRQGPGSGRRLSSGYIFFPERKALLNCGRKAPVL